MSFICKSNIFIFCIIITFTNCNNSTYEQNTKDEYFVDTLIQRENSGNKDESSFKLDSYNNQEVLVTYQSATMYATSTHYYFETEIGEEILVIEDFSIQETEIKLPKNMLEELEEEGLPEGNPALIGNTFKLYFNAKGKVYKVIASK